MQSLLILRRGFLLWAKSGITTGAGYSITLAAVERTRFQGLKAKEYPAAMVVPMSEAVSMATNSIYTLVLQLSVFVVVRSADSDDGDDLDKRMNEALACVIKAMETDTTRGGKAITTDYKGSRSFGPTDLMPFGDVKAEFEITYRQNRTNPYAVV